MQTKRFSQLTVVAVIVVSIIVLIWAGREGAKTIPLELELPVATSTPAAPLAYDMIDIKTPKGTIKAMVASTTAQRERGLSGRESLAKDSGMLFVFPNAGVFGFWMRDMNFPIDIVWIDADKNVSGVAPGVSPDTYPEIFYPSKEVLYVLELSSGSARDHMIATGTKLVF